MAALATWKPRRLAAWRHRLFTVATIFSAVVFVAAGTLWFLANYISLLTDVSYDGQRFTRGRGYFEPRWRLNSKTARARWETVRFSVFVPHRDATGPPYGSRAYAEWESGYRDEDFVIEDVRSLSLWWRWAVILLHRGSDGQYSHSELIGYCYGVEAPYWTLLVVSSLLPLAWWGRHVRAARRRAREARRARTGLCPACGYDLRGSPGRPCPECGAVTPDRAPAVATS